MKTYEARLTGEEDPYDTADLIKKREAVRAQINELQQEVAALDKEMQKACAQQ